MKKLIVSNFVSMDGIIESPWEWVGDYFDNQNQAYSVKKLEEVDTFLPGRLTYDRFSTTWPQIQGNDYFDKINSLPKIVPSKTLKEATWNAKVIPGDVLDWISELKRQGDKDILKYGLGPLDRLLFQHGLIDEFQLGLVPKILGKGLRLFGDFDQSELKLTLSGTITMDNGVIYLTYIPGR